ncbi:MAG: nuclear transport factor 2 family protein, partial [Melioribacteraceae bacterium]|nr:nuclear transport factor 2 family protein [Melioribacteraceae bacterium]
MKKLILSVMALCLLFFFSVNEKVTAQDSGSKLGEKLTNEFWEVIKDGTIESFADRIADGFLSLHPDGTRHKPEEIELIKGIKLGEYELTDFVESRIGNTIMVTYKVTSQEELAGHKIKEAYRMTIWHLQNDVWLLGGHCNLAGFVKT